MFLLGLTMILTERKLFFCFWCLIYVGKFRVRDDMVISFKYPSDISAQGLHKKTQSFWLFLLIFFYLAVSLKYYLDNLFHY